MPCRVASLFLGLLGSRLVLEEMLAWVGGQWRLKGLDAGFLTVAEAALYGVT